MLSRNQLAANLLDRFSDAPSRTLARILYRENLELFPNAEAARSTIRRVRGAIGKQHRKKIAKRYKPYRREGQPAGWVPKCPPSLEEPWVPFELPIGRILSLSDAHIPFHDRPAVEAAVKWGRKWKPDVVLINGDWCDFYSVSRWERDPKHRDLSKEMELCKESLCWLRRQFKKALFVYKIGNHEERWDKYVWNKAPELFNLPQVRLEELLDFEGLGIQRVADVPVLAGALPIFHGHEFQTSANNPVNPARGAFLRAGGSCLIAHHHRTSSHGESDWDHTETMAWSQGCLCGLSPKYARVNRWNHGFAVIEVRSDSQYSVQNLRISKDLIVRP